MDGQLRQLQLTQFEIFKVVDRFCKEHNIKYSLYAGTLLGAVRHQGFIPWDDDLDICMSRADYNRFIELWNKYSPDGYILMNKDTSPAFSQSFTKIRKDHTTFLQSKDEIGKYHTGIFIDIFPIDRIPDGKLRRKLFLWRCMQYQLLMREFPPTKNGALKKFVSRVILALTPKSKRAARRRKLLSEITAFNDNHDYETAAIETMASLRRPFANDMLDEYTTVRFEDGEYMCYAGWDEHLKRKFGDYMQLPPESERVWKHTQLVIDFEHNYDELPEEQKI